MRGMRASAHCAMSALRGPFKFPVGPARLALEPGVGVRLAPVMASSSCGTSCAASALESEHFSFLRGIRGQHAAVDSSGAAATAAAAAAALLAHGSSAGACPEATVAALPPLPKARAGAPEPLRRRVAATFYKRTLPCPPAVAFSSSEGTHCCARTWLEHARGLEVQSHCTGNAERGDNL